MIDKVASALGIEAWDSTITSTSIKVPFSIQITTAGKSNQQSNYYGR